ncbi:MAG: uncharacterized protein KVP18_000735 [Porospora cf. gigantea A]|uniref:uncharacterized protein n=1 Tax=Porospora cf. gigantea A TaxID=2853593 RepID=UPI00355AB316|nr:MAG: hypothetical protein KVP18_000735 [Porospora cf. gigantea A]
MSNDPTEQVRYVEVPVIEEVVRHVPRKEVVTIDTHVPRYEVETIEKVVEVPRIEIVEKTVEVEHTEEVVRHVPVKQIIDIPKEVITYVPKIETKTIEKVVEVPGDVVEVPQPYTVENTIVVPKYIDTERQTVVSQTLQPVVKESPFEKMDVVMREFDPYLVPVDIYVPRPVDRTMIPGAKREELRRVEVPATQFNALVRNANPVINDKDLDGIYRKHVDGSIPTTKGSGTALVEPKRVY